jgi:hypothetical protein
MTSCVIPASPPEADESRNPGITISSGPRLEFIRLGRAGVTGLAVYYVRITNQGPDGGKE